MTGLSFAARLADAGLRLSEAEAAKLAALVADMEAGPVAVARAPRPYREEPAAVFRLSPTD